MVESFWLAQAIEARKEKWEFKDIRDFWEFLWKTNPKFKEWAKGVTSEEIANAVQMETGFFAETIIDAMNLKRAVVWEEGNVAKVIRIS